MRFNEDKDVVLGKDIEFAAGRKKLSFGMVVALTGDFLGDYTVGIGDVDQLSDTWSTWPTKGVMRSVPRLEKRLQDDQAGIVERVMDLMKKQRKEFDEKKAEPGRDAIQVHVNSLFDGFLLILFKGLQGDRRRIQSGVC